MEQNSLEWHRARLGKVTSSNFHKLAGSRGLGKTGETYVHELAAGYIGVKVPEAYAKSMEWGSELEPDAREYYKLSMSEFLSVDLTIETEGFVQRKDMDAGFSPDGIVTGESGKLHGPLHYGLEIKCPYNPGNHVKHMRVNNAGDLLNVEPKHYWQICFSLWVSGWDYWHFVSYDPRFTGKQRMHIAKIVMPDGLADFIEERTREALDLRNQILNEIKN